MKLPIVRVSTLIMMLNLNCCEVLILSGSTVSRHLPVSLKDELVKRALPTNDAVCDGVLG